MITEIKSLRQDVAAVLGTTENTENQESLLMMSMKKQQNNDFKVCCDSGATNHFFEKKSHFTSLRTIPARKVITGKKGEQYYVDKIGIRPPSR